MQINKKLLLLALVLLLVLVVACSRDYATAAQAGVPTAQQYAAQGCGVA